MTRQHDSDSTDTMVYFCEGAVPLPHVSLRELPPPDRQAIAELHIRQRWPNLRLAVIWGCIALCAWISSRSDNLAVWVVTAFIIGASFVSLATFVHESAHNLVFRRRWLNRVTGTLCSFPLLAGPTAYRTVHMVHHVHTRDGQDPDDPEAPARKGVPLGLWYFIALMVGSYLYVPHLIMSGWRFGSRETKALIVLDTAVVVIGHVALFVALPLELWLRLWLFPYLVAGQLINVKGLSEHGLTAPDNQFTSTRSVLGTPLTRFWLCNQNYHLEHHLYPGVPWYNLHELHQLVDPVIRRSGASVYRSYSAFIRDFVRAGRAGMVHDALLLPRELRDHFCG